MRKALFWMHLAAGCVAGSVILVMSATGALLAFQPQVLRFVERAQRRIEPPVALPTPLPPEALLAGVLSQRPGARPASLTLDADPRVAALVGAGRDAVLHVDPYSGEVRGEGAPGWRAFFRQVTDLHRWLAVAAGSRDTARGVTGACNAAFLFLSMSGLYLWWPRQWTRRQLRPVVFFQRGLRGKARDFNWHNAIGLWCAPVIFFLTLTALTISYPLVGNALYQGTPTAPPASARPEAAPTAEAFVGLDGAWAAARERVPGWTLGVLRVARAGAPVTVAITDSPWRSPYGRSQLSYDPRTREVAKWEPFAEFAPGRKTRTAARWLHTGEILSWPGQLVAGLASLGGAFLVWTGLSLAWRRFRAWRVGRKTCNQTVAREARPA
jgi:uncharacterized iron-regulated membrane protein